MSLGGYEINQPRISATANQPINSQTFTVPARSGFGDLAFWFACSNNGKFKKDFTSVVKGRLKAGKPIGITHEFDRATCKAPADGYKVIRAYWTTPSCKQGSATVGSSSFVYHSGLVKSTFTAVIAPEDVTAGDLAVWFQCQTSADSQYESNLGKNWHLTVSA
ncbi:hypothetical protein HDU96_008050 [Phlyctochytrium bullatum]|nr:hypothetical protein HDU96_008050 [Phlyctochytrium bullatum]